MGDVLRFTDLVFIKIYLCKFARPISDILEHDYESRKVKFVGEFINIHNSYFKFYTHTFIFYELSDLED